MFINRRLLCFFNMVKKKVLIGYDTKETIFPNLIGRGLEKRNIRHAFAQGYEGSINGVQISEYGVDNSLVSLQNFHFSL